MACANAAEVQFADTGDRQGIIFANNKDAANPAYCPASCGLLHKG